MTWALGPTTGEHDTLPMMTQAELAAELGDDMEPAMPAWPHTFNWWPFFALLSLIFGAIGLWHLWAVLS